MPERPVKVFFSYAREDDGLRKQLYRHLAVLRRERSIDAWYDGELIPGQPWRPEILAQLEASQVIVMLVSSDFLASDFCTSVEMELNRAVDTRVDADGGMPPTLHLEDDALYEVESLLGQEHARWQLFALGGAAPLADHYSVPPARDASFGDRRVGASSTSLLSSQQAKVEHEIRKLGANK